MYSIRLEGDVRKLIHKLDKMENLDKKKLNTLLADVVATSTELRFRQQKGPDGKRWEPSQRTKTMGGVTLTKNAELKNSLNGRAERDGFAFGTNKVYGRTHQFGDKRKIKIRAKTSRGLIFKIGDQWIRKREVEVPIEIPARPYLGLNDDDLLEIKATTEDFIGRDD